MTTNQTSLLSSLLSSHSTSGPFSASRTNGTPSPQRKKIVALSEELQKIKDVNIKLAAAIKKKGKAKVYNNNRDNGKGKGKYKGKNSPW